jgi:hypothetical protein
MPERLGDDFRARPGAKRSTGRRGLQRSGSGMLRVRSPCGPYTGQPVVGRQPWESAMVSENLEALVIEKTFRVPAPAGPPGDGQAAARQFDVVLMSAGFKCSGRC